MKFTSFGVDIRLHWSFYLGLVWFLLVLGDIFTQKLILLQYECTTWLPLLMGLFTSLGLYFSIVCHEFGHILMARRCSTGPPKTILLCMVGGIAQADSVAMSPFKLFLVIASGPLVSALLALVFYGLEILSASFLRIGIAIPLAMIFDMFCILNIMISCFNMFPAYPMDGGQILWSITWGLTKDMRKGLRIASLVGIFFGTLLFTVSIVSLKPITAALSVLIVVYCIDSSRNSAKIVEHFIERDRTCRKESLGNLKDQTEKGVLGSYSSSS